MNLNEATMKALEGKLIETNTEGYRAVEIVDASEPNTHYMTIMLSNKHTVDEFQKEMWRVRDKHWDEIQKYGNDLEVVLSDIDPSFDWFELDDDAEKLTI